MKVSVLIPTLGRNQELIDTIEGLAQQTRPPDEIIICDQNNPPFSEVIEVFKKNPLIKHFTGLSPGVVVNYNRCLEKSIGDIVIFVDDDVTLKNDFIEKHLLNYKDSQVHAVAGKILSAFGDRDPQKINQVGRYNYFLGSTKAQFNALQKQGVDFSQGANMSFRRKVLNDIGGFDEKFTGNGFFFEVDVGLKLKNHGFNMVFDPDAELYHHMAGHGGARIHNKALHTYYFIKHGIVIYKRYSPLVLLPIFILNRLGYLILKSLYNRSFKIFTQGIRGLVEGLAI